MITYYSEFSAKDPFNPQNHVEGQVSFSRDTRYGSLKIQKINGKFVDQPQIFGTPKIAYPFGLGHNYRFPSAERIYRFLKYDGTNIFMYRYKNNGMEYITFKVRLFPFLRGHYITMWQYMLRKYPQITEKTEDTEKKIWELTVMHAFNSNTDAATVFHKIANQFDQDKRLIYKAIKNVQNMMKFEGE